ncbi:dd863abd-2be4-43ff-bb9e-2dcd3accaada [Thermothielavioides terrestris]|uniref:Dd863abd-2be4-43ff-bb9e-2dcd3accaada n=1 Tax=Thermothielavioides terrestris TaxID=2587410 RepID=A0A446BGZ3_9PEZI|nr:dd863abd-2be4-43ff-bb9e-2dcd3accaada [Thermothielavioides terrestris]
MPLSPEEAREAANRLHDIELLRAERVVSHQEHDAARPPATVAVTPLETTWLAKLRRRLTFPRILRYLVYTIPPGLLILIPVFLASVPMAARGTRVTSIMPPVVTFAADTIDVVYKIIIAFWSSLLC